MLPGKNLVFIQKSPRMVNKNRVLDMMTLVVNQSVTLLGKNVLETWP